VNEETEFLKCSLADGVYTSELTGNSVVVKNGQMRVPASVDIVSFSGQIGLKVEPIESFIF